MRILSFIILFFFTVTTGWAQRSDTRGLKHFSKVKAYGHVNVTLHLSDVEKVKVKAVGMDAADVNTKVKGTTLRINLKGNLFEDKTVNVDVYYRNISELLTAAGASMSSSDAIEAKNLELHVSSGSVMQMEFSSGSVEVNATEGGMVELQGAVEFLEARVATGGILKAYNLAADNVVVKATTGGVAKVEAGIELQVHANLGGVVHYRGSPARFTSDATLGGLVKKD